MRQEIRFCIAADGVRLANAVYGNGPVIVKAAHWLTHLEHDWRSPVWRHWLDALGTSHRATTVAVAGCPTGTRGG